MPAFDPFRTFERSGPWQTKLGFLFPTGAVELLALVVVAAALLIYVIARQQSRAFRLQKGGLMDKESEHIKTLLKARERMVAERRALAGTLPKNTNAATQWKNISSRYKTQSMRLTAH
jgi:hypothetical protein